MHNEIASLLRGGGVVLKKSGVLVIRSEDAEEGCKFSGILHIDRGLSSMGANKVGLNMLSKSAWQLEAFSRSLIVSGWVIDLLDAIGVVDGFEPDNSLGGGPH
jgi:hypothetical protein